MSYKLARLRPSLRNLAIFNDTTFKKLRTMVALDKPLHKKMKAKFLKAMTSKKKKEEYLSKFEQKDKNT